MLVRAALLLTNIDYGGKMRFLCKRHIVTFLDFLSFFGKKGGGGGCIFTAQKSAGNHTQRGQINVQQAFIPIHLNPSSPFRTIMRHEFECSWTAFQKQMSRVSLSCYYWWFVGEVTEAMLVIKNKSISPLWELNPFSCKFFQKNFIVLTTNMAAWSRVCKPRIGWWHVF